MAKQEIPDSGQWSLIAGLINSNTDELYAADVARRQVLRASEPLTQTPGLVGPVDITFGSSAVNGPSDSVQMGADNIFTFNEDGDFHFRFSTQASRTASSGTANVFVAAFLDPGTGTFIQSGQSVKFIVPDSNTNIPYQAELTATMQAGWRFKAMIQIVGQADAGLFGDDSVPNSWNDVFSADMLISQYFYLPE
ncbi:MAG: hypothetical protein ACN2B6_01360 [Rickettsiales bacterium]